MRPGPSGRSALGLSLAVLALSGCGGASGASTSVAEGSLSAAPRARPIQWTSVDLGTTTFGATACSTPDRCFAFGLAGTLATSTDAGRSWRLSKQQVLASLDVLSAACLSGTRCVALAVVAPQPPYGIHERVEAGVALVSQDGGLSWSRSQVRGAWLEFSGGLSCPTTNLCYAAATNSTGKQGSLVVSTDAGTIWAIRRTAPVSGPTGLACTTASRCLVASWSGILLTSNGGRSWQHEHEPLGGGGYPGITSLSCSTSSDCTGAGTEQHPGYPVLISTQDGGRSWRFARVPMPNNLFEDSIGGGYSALSCAGPRCAAVEPLAGAGLVAYSRDGGRSWRSVSLGPANLSGVTCTSDGDCVITGQIANGSALIAVGGPGPRWQVRYRGPPTVWTTLTCTSDKRCVAGTSGQPVGFSAIATGSQRGAPWSYAVTPRGLTGVLALACPTLRHCVAAATVAAPPKLAEQGSTSVVGAMLSSDDGGRHWRRGSLEPALDTVDALACPSASICYGAGQTPGGAGILPQDVVVKTTDGGADWVKSNVPAFPPQPVAGTSGSAVPGGGLTSIYCSSLTDCVAAGPGGVMATNNGHSWSVRWATPTPGHGGVLEGGVLEGQLQSFTCSTSARCIGAFTASSGGDQLRYSSDGGRSWHKTSATPPFFLANALVCEGRSQCLAAGSGRRGGVVLESADAGRHWAVAPVPALGAGPFSPAAYSSAACSTSGNCLVLGSGSTGVALVYRS